MKLRTFCVLVLVAAAACASHDEGRATPTNSAGPSPVRAPRADPEIHPEPNPDPKPDAPPEPEPEPSTATASIASVQMIQDCPDPAPSTTAAPASAAAEKAKKPMPPRQGSRSRAARGSSLHGGGPRQRCTQSTMQLAFASQGDDSARVVIERVTMLDADTSEALATIASRRPMAWVDGSYREWDELVPAGGSTKASYSLSVPDWHDVEGKVGGASFGHMFVVEVQLSIAGQQRTVRSPAFTRERPHVIVT